MDNIQKIAEQMAAQTSGINTMREALKKLDATSSIRNALKGLENYNLPNIAAYIPPRVNLPTIDPELVKVPTPEERNNYQSASILMRRLASAVTEWRKQLPEGVQPAILAILHGGVQVDVNSLAQESFHGIRIDGIVNGVPCIVLAHQNTVQLLCYAQPINPPESPKRKIGFIIDGEESEA